jgi:hypothetical protein
MFFLGILALFVFKSSLHTSSDGQNSILTPLDKIISENDDMNYKAGYYEPEFNHPDDCKEKIIEISENFRKYNILKILENPNINNINKIKLLKKNYLITDNISPNLLNGGLLDEWIFSIEQ